MLITGNCDDSTSFSCRVNLCYFCTTRLQENTVPPWDCFACSLIVQNIIIDTSEVVSRIQHQASYVFGLHCVALGHLVIMSISNLKLATCTSQPSDQSINLN